MAIVKWDPFREFDELQTRLDRLFPMRAGRRPLDEETFFADWSPAADVQDKPLAGWRDDLAGSPASRQQRHQAGRRASAHSARSPFSRRTLMSVKPASVSLRVSVRAV